MSSSPFLVRVAAGERDAVQQCIDAHGRLVWSLARRLSPTREDAEDAVQEIFLDLWKSAGRYDPGKASEAAFIATIARRRLIDRRRRAAARPSEALPEGTALPANEPSVERGVEARLAARALNDLPEAQRRAVWLSTCHGLSHSEIAELTGTPLGTVKSHVRRGLAAVRERLLGQASAQEGGLS